MARRNLAIFTICSNNYVGMAKVLLETARQHHPEATLYLCLADVRLPEPGFYPAGCKLVTASELGIPQFEEFTFRYDIMEFNTALKPFMFRRLLREGHDAVLYFDPDIEIFSRLEQILDPLRNGASFVLTPHLCQPAEGESFPNDIGIMRAGIYNLGFLGVGAGAEAELILRWWSRRLQYDCINDQDRGIFVDQKFMDLIPGFGDHVRILRDPAVNVAYWNLHQRGLDDAHEKWTVDGRPLGFFHFSGFDANDLTRLSKYTEAFRGKAMTGPLLRLCRAYSSRLLANNHGDVPKGVYGFGRFASGTPIPETVRRMFRERHPTWSGGNPFEVYEEYLHLPAAEAWHGSKASVVTNLMRYMHASEAGLARAFDVNTRDGAAHYARWFTDQAAGWLGDPRFTEPVAERIGNATPPARSTPPRPEGTPDVSVIGYLRAALGLGEAGRAILRSLGAAGISREGVEVTLNSASTRNDASCDSLLASRATGRFQIFAINADQLPTVRTHMNAALAPDAYTIAAPFWELSEFPAPWLDALRDVDEIWATTHFIQTALVRKLPGKPVLRMPLALDFVPPPALPRSALGLPEHAFLFFFAFDYFSFIARKNPLATVAAFKRAFRGRNPRHRDVRLVIKTLNAEIVPQSSRALREALCDDPDIHLIEQTCSRNETLGLIGACDAVISLHRSEGLGLLVAEAMVLGKPVVATDYSATTELVTPRTGYPVDFKLIPVCDGEYPFHHGQVWADADIDHAAWQMRRIVADETGRGDRVRAAKAHILQNYSTAVVGRKQHERLRRIDRS